MTILIAIACVIIAFFFFPLSTIDYVGAKAKARFASWKSLFSKEEGK